MNDISVVINTLNEEKNIERAIRSAKEFASEIIVCDMHSEDSTVVIARKMGAKIIYHKKTGYVEPARNFAIGKVSKEWILVLDADEEVPATLANHLVEMVEKPIVASYVEIPRRNIVFGKSLKASMWWPDYNIRFFKKGSAVWDNRIHSTPQTNGEGLRLPADDKWAIIHHHYSSITEFVERMNRYTSIEAKDLKDAGVSFEWQLLIQKPLSEFLSRFFANKGFEDGLHGLSLSFLQAVSFFLVYLKLWEYEGFSDSAVSSKSFKDEYSKANRQLDWWFKYGNLSRNPITSFVQRLKNKLV